MSKLIIHNKTPRPDLEVLGYISAIVSKGKISGDGDDAQYSVLSTFYLIDQPHITVTSTKSGDTHTFKVIEDIYA